MNKFIFTVLTSVLVPACSTQSINNDKAISLSELSFEFHKQLDKHNVQLPVTTEYISEFGMYVLRVDESKYFKQDAVISIDPEQIDEFKKLVLKIKKEWKQSTKKDFPRFSRFISQWFIKTEKRYSKKSSRTRYSAESGCHYWICQDPVRDQGAGIPVGRNRGSACINPGF